MPNPNESPAVQSLKKEQAAQRERADRGELEKGLEDTFPASDPVSATHTAVSTSRTTTDYALDGAGQASKRDNRYSLVDEALEATHENTGSRLGQNSRRAEIHALKTEANRLTESASQLASGTARVAKAQTRDFARDIEDRVRERPLVALGLVAAVAFVLGVTR
ncbi:hypothetical protein [Oryzifoliimicrobium ureilyticus]|uniref:hypothetical protein n=1 Tax=Oryzifoliimicrobium ureilyticus TaxID=3113724 RepID=UPI0030766DDC